MEHQKVLLKGTYWMIRAYNGPAKATADLLNYLHGFTLNISPYAIEQQDMKR